MSVQVSVESLSKYSWNGCPSARGIPNLLYKITAVVFSPRVDHFDVEFTTIRANQCQRNQLRGC
ncbi:hypothetical protein, partial [Pseudomonas syringae]